VSAIDPFCFLLVGGVLVMAAFVRVLAPQSPTLQDLTLTLGARGGATARTDTLGRDVFRPPIVGARSALPGPARCPPALDVFGNCSVAGGFRGGRSTQLIMRWVDLMM